MTPFTAGSGTSLDRQSSSISRWQRLLLGSEKLVAFQVEAPEHRPREDWIHLCMLESNFRAYGFETQ